MKNLLLSLVVPRKMEQHRSLNLFIAVLLIIMCVFISVGPSIIRTDHFLKKHILENNLSFYAYDSNYELSAGYDLTLPTFTYDDDYSIDQTSIKYPKDVNGNNIHIFDIPLKASDNTNINVKLVYELNKTIEDELDFDLVTYMNEENKENEVNILIVFTKSYYYYIYNRGYLTYQDAEEPFYFYTTNETDEYNLFHENEVDGVKSYQYIGTNNIYQLFMNKSGEIINFGLQVYASFAVLDNDFGSIEGDAATVYNMYNQVMLAETSSYVKLVTYIYGFFYTAIFSILWVLSTWLMSRKIGELVFFREYYAICAISFILPSTIFGVLSYFVPYIMISRFCVLAQAGFYIFSVVVINRAKNHQKSDDTNIPKKMESVEYEVVTTKINGNQVTKSPSTGQRTIE